MESEKVKEIKKAIEYNTLSEFMCVLPYADEFNKLKAVSFVEILTLINELESENERLMKLQARGGCRVAELGIENQQLKDRIAELEKELTDDRVFYKNGICYPMNCQGTLKQFAESLKAKMPCEEVFKGIWDKIDETLKEFIDK